MDNILHFSKVKLNNITGNDVVDFLQRVSTNEFSGLQINNFRSTFFLNNKGRIIDLVTVFNINNKIKILTSEINNSKVKDYFDKYVIADDVQFLELESDYIRCTLFGEEIINKFIFNLKLDRPVTGRFINFDNRLIMYHDFYKSRTLNIILKQDEKDFLVNQLKPYNPSDKNEFDYYRIINHFPIAPNELNEDFNPLDCEMEMFINSNKGCYIGQEVIARLESQNKVQYKLMDFKTYFKIQEKDVIYCRFNDIFEKCGQITTISCIDGLYYFLGYVRKNLLSNDFYINYNNEYKKIN